MIMSDADNLYSALRSKLENVLSEMKKHIKKSNKYRDRGKLSLAEGEVRLARMLKTEIKDTLQHWDMMRKRQPIFASLKSFADGDKDRKSVV